MIKSAQASSTSAEQAINAAAALLDDDAAPH
jgi:hypothetical protein